MKFNIRRSGPYALAFLTLTAFGSVGCSNQHHGPLFKTAEVPPPPSKLGAATMAMWQRQEDNAEACDFVMNELDFAERDDTRLNECGKHHLQQIALRLIAGGRHPVIIERSKYGFDPRATEDDFNYPIHPDPELDNRRRQMIVRVLGEMGVPCPDDRVFVGSSYSEHISSQQALENFGRFNDQPDLLNQGFAPQGFGFGGGFIGGIF